ncbi:MAG: transglutaminase family protein [Epsilonproteobacteria bacterium]|nr:transglutaminase family protein [Campylobacterota bacterium]OIO16388.1 MAG: IMP dehydrogenase [Helicobacteraceae bacterium CG1_02_36_14]PIP11336.1 MAG: IMP dehydrogenase [Sulfurimonas sp. CG23_combo_of_CG06-09_8_20_14_all_36_33]PIS26020.1 MAG: IMP dehydrogenase [Sulfurimonas sp. CG08_land_8_20_14_0_20_36_33]PIU35681.1 MAG: IMP dehydrogenase [Sulfurimonas sp. CG07_land_8_20_14_0_80_36_56]PIV04880.1 MAG: IMP dehydrogenase [Sulfurimonas sp. CG03_land_8_20_14_0_80_36_25]PIV34436.1 MAG: IMP deh
MSLKVVLSHKTHYKYDKFISLSPHTIRLRPAPHSRTPIDAYSMKITPENHFINWQQDAYGNYLARVVFPEKVKEFGIDVEVIADLISINPFDFFVEAYAEEYPFEYKSALKKELLPYFEVTEEGKLLKKFIKTLDLKERKINDFLVYLNSEIYNYLNYTVRLEAGVQPCEVTLDKKLGSCRDYAWLFVQVLRSLGFAARFVSGYLVQLKQDEKSLDGPSGPEEDFTDLHAWTEVYLPGAGWVGLDSTSGLFAGEGHIPLACTAHYESAHAIEGLSDKCETEFEFSNTVTRIFESPRVTKPYRDDQWDAINSLGYEVDVELEENDVRLSMGGEPTFVSIDDMESDQWNTGADGPEKRALADTLSRRLLSSFGKGGILHYAQGKWYPGEPVPRWQTSIIWRKDGKKIWKDPSLFANMNESYNYTDEDAKKFLENLAHTLKVSGETILTAYEDPIHYIMKEAELPIDIDPLEYDIDNATERNSIAKVLGQGLSKEVGYVLPLNYAEDRWMTSFWSFRREKLFLIPGDSPLGLRLPMDSLIEKPENELPLHFEPDLFAKAPKLKKFLKKATKRLENSATYTIKNDPEATFIRTGLNIEIRDGKLYIFLPPLNHTDAFLDLIASIEAVAKKLNIKVILEGYEPAHDLRLETIKVTPDPGVIEVNIQPVNSWKELTTNLFTLYNDARESRLGTEKFMLDGKHTGTGGGNHVTIGAMKPVDSPLLRRPEVLRSLITFWQHHPGLSYLFSGAFIGPTSQAPRVDEGRLENLYELEIAFSQIPLGEEVPFWITDRLFRHMLTDITGNTHRSEFCIDKLYSPDSSTGRLGILELRGFDMPPHPKMALLQNLLIRTLVSLFWRKPYKHKLVRWGTQLHDKFLLEHYVREDLKDIVEFLNNEGYNFKLDWFDPFFEFRFPLYGMATVENVHLELRSAIEPWHVLGEESSSQGTSRYVDSSLERVQIKVNNFVPERYVLTCNSVVIPLSPSGVEGEFVAGVKYKAWQPWSALHPTIGVDTPLTFDIVDKWNERSIGGMTYHVSHPGGRTYETFPINAGEAESRRVNRFQDFNHTQGNLEYVATSEVQQSLINVNGAKRAVVLKEKPEDKLFLFQEVDQSLEYPNTLDLRRKWAKQ